MPLRYRQLMDNQNYFGFFQTQVTGTSGPPNQLTHDSTLQLKERSAVQDVIQFVNKLLGQIGLVVCFTAVCEQPPFVTEQCNTGA